VSRPTLAERFWAKVQKTDGCWLWTGCRNRLGYGKIKVRSYVTEPAHRVALKLSGVEVPDDMDACHHCDNPRCVRPDHLFVGTRKDNMQDAVRKGRMVSVNALRTECKRGHPLSGDNLILQPDGHRNCRECQLMHGRLHDARRRPRKRAA
jgi:hypothetical protein